MPDEPSFDDFLRRVRAGDDDAAEELVRRYGPALRMEVKLRLADPKVRRLLDPEDVCQSVLGSFFARAAVGQFDLDRPEQLMGLLVTMARNKVGGQVRRQRALRRDNRREQPAGSGLFDPPADEPSPSRHLMGREALGELRRRLGDEERLLADLRAQGRSWAEIAEQLGGTPQARRKQLARAVDRIARDLGLAEVGE
jgi:RNA polymerase sigma factor (sigma-70 family)